DQRHSADFDFSRLGRECGHYRETIGVRAVHARDARAVADPKMIEARRLGVFGGAPEFFQAGGSAVVADPMARVQQQAEFDACHQCATRMLITCGMPEMICSNDSPASSVIQTLPSFIPTAKQSGSSASPATARGAAVICSGR